jgi:hypothetical protein
MATYCRCDPPLPSILKIVSGGANKGKKYQSCQNYVSKENPGCGYFNWYNGPSQQEAPTYAAPVAPFNPGNKRKRPEDPFEGCNIELVGLIAAVDKMLATQEILAKQLNRLEKLMNSYSKSLQPPSQPARKHPPPFYNQSPDELEIEDEYNL